MPTITLVWGLCADQLCAGRVFQPTCGECTFHCYAWDPPCCLGASTAGAMVPEAVLVSSGWTHTVRVSAHGVAYVADTGELRQSDRHSDPDLSSAVTHQQQFKQQQRPPQLHRTIWQKVCTQLPATALLLHAPQAAAVQISQISCGDQHCLLLDQHGRVWAFGSNNHGQLGTAAAPHTPAAARGAAGEADQQQQQHVDTQHMAAAVAVSEGAAAEQQHMEGPTAVRAVLVLGPGSPHSCQEPVMQVNSRSASVACLDPEFRVRSTGRWQQAPVTASQ
eukprot:GHUV01045551.1.p1 GENE.GHUV01045551.1~~GHUV01045551.1.p1  ORF type:complete len:277 (+),score=83.20 GHUV01045551.1:72-902(+)